MADKVGQAEYELDLDTSKFETKATNAGNHLKTVISVAAGIEFQRISEQFRQLGAEIFNLVADFDHYIITLGSQGAIAQNTAQAIAQAMLDMSRNTLFGASEIVVAVSGVAQRLETLTGREVNVADATKFMSAATDLAVASSSDLTSATSTLINVMLAYKIPLDRVAEATDLVFNLSRITGVEFITLALAADRLKARLGEAAPTLEDTGTVLAMVNELGITGSRGLLVLVSGIESLTSGSKDVNNELNRLGVGVYDAQGQFVGFRAVIDQLSGVYAKMTPQQRQMSADILFSSQASNILLGLIDKGVGSFDAFNARITETGTVTTGATQHINDLSGQVEIFKNRVGATAIELGNKLEPAITKTIASVNGLLTFMVKNEEVMTAVAIVAAGVLVSALILVTAVIWQGVAALIAFAIASNVAFLGIPILIAAAVAGVVILITHFEEVVNFFQNNWPSLLIFIANPFLGAFSLIAENWKFLFDHMPEPFQNFLIQVAAVVDTMVNLFLEGIRKIAEAIDKLDVIGKIPDLANEVPGGLDLSGTLQARQTANRQAKEEKQFFEEFLRGDQAPKAPEPSGGGGGGPPVIPDFRGDPGKAAKQIPQLGKDLLALAAAFKAWSDLTGDTNIENFKVYIKLHEAEIVLKQREQDAMTALNVSSMLATNQSYQLRLAFVQMAEEAARSGRSLNEVIRDTFDGLADKAKGLLDEILNGPTREGTELQLRIDKLRRQALLLERGGADSGRVGNKPGDPQPSAADRQLKKIEDSIEALELEQQIRQVDISIMKNQVILKDQTLRYDRDLANATVFLGAVIGNLTGTVHNLDEAMGGLIEKLKIELGVPQLNVGLPYVPLRMLAILDPEEAVLRPQQAREWRMGQSGSRGPLASFNFSFNGNDYDKMKQDMNRQYDEAIWQIRRRGSATPKGSYSGR